VTKNLMLAAMGILLIGFIGCEIKTPEIRGVVLDAETKQPVEGAWITGMIAIRSKTMAGDVTNYLSVEPPHTRTDKSGKFLIPSKLFEKPSFPIGLGTEVKSFGLGANTIDDRGASVDLMEFLGKHTIETAILIRPEYIRETEGEYFAHLQALYKYCLTGRFVVELPGVEGGCDGWELDFVIAKYERYLEKFTKIIQERGYSTALDYLAELYERKGNYEKAIKAHKESIALMERRGLLKFEVWQKNRDTIERKIKKLQEKLEQKQK